MTDLTKTTDRMKMTPDQVREHNQKGVERRRLLAQVEDAHNEAAASSHNPYTGTTGVNHNPANAKPPAPTPKGNGGSGPPRGTTEPIHRTRLIPDLSDRRCWVLHLDLSESFEEVVRRKRFFARSVDKLARGHTIELFGCDLSWRAVLIVVKTNETLGLVWTRVLQKPEPIVALDGDAFEEMGEVKIEQTAPTRFRVLMGANVAVSDLPSEAAAQRWININLIEGETS